MNITFKTHDNFLAFQNMAENMWLNYRDDNQEPEFGIVDRLIDELNHEWEAVKVYPMTLPVSTTVEEMAKSVLENCLEYTSDGYEPDDDEPVIHAGEVTIS